LATPYLVRFALFIQYTPYGPPYTENKFVSYLSVYIQIQSIAKIHYTILEINQDDGQTTFSPLRVHRIHFVCKTHEGISECITLRCTILRVHMNKVKVKFTLEQAMKDQRGVGVQLYILTSALDRDG
jgi:hypothetical protein